MQTAPASRRCRLLVLTLACLAALVTGAEAGESEHLHLPLSGKRIRNFARAEIESHWVSGNGYRPVKVTIINMPPGPTKFDRDFRVRLTPHGGYGHTTTVMTEAIVEMPEGSTQGTAWLAVPQLYHWESMDVEVREGGQRIDELSHPSMQLNSPNIGMGNNVYSEAMPSVLFIDSDAPARNVRDSLVSQFRSLGSAAIKTPTFDLPDIRMWQYIVPQANDPYNRSGVAALVAPGAGRASDVEILNLISQNAKLEILHPSQLPDHWLRYTCLDLVFISLDDAVQLADKQPDRWEALRRWAASGPTLIITDVGDKLERIAQLNKLADLAQQPARPGDVEGHGGWVQAKSEFASGRVRAVDNAMQAEYGPINPLNPDGTPGNPLAIVPVDTNKMPFAIREFGLGHIVAFASDNPLDNPPHGMAWLLNQLESRNWMNYQRHGVSFTRQNSDFMTFLIEGTGRVPVWSFLVLITGFVVVIGPVNYLLLQRWRRLFLLLVTVPLGAAIITISLFSYALISDGLGVRTRARSYTHLDQRSGEMAMWSRQSYYAGLAPSGGLRFPADTAVYPIDERPSATGSGRTREVAWSDDTQQLRSGFISSRQTSQYLVIGSGKSERKLEVKNTTAGAPPKVTNKLDAHIEHLVLRDHEGNYFQLQDLPPGEEAAMLVPTRADKKDLTPGEKYTAAIKPFSLLYNERRPTAPLGYQSDEYAGGLFGFTRGRNRYYYYNQGYERSLPSPTFSSSVLERELQLAATNNASEIAPGSYLAVLTTSPEMPLGYRKVREQGSFHILEGRW